MHILIVSRCHSGTPVLVGNSIGNVVSGQLSPELACVLAGKLVAELFDTLVASLVDKLEPGVILYHHRTEPLGQVRIGSNIDLSTQY